MVARSRAVADRLARGVEHLFRKNKIELVAGEATLGGLTGDGRRTVKVASKGGQTDHDARSVIVATGARARSLPALEPDGERIISYREALVPKALPRRLMVVGAGAIGCEFASFYRDLGVEVTLVEALDRVLPIEDLEISEALTRAFTKRGIRVLSGTSVAETRHDASGIRAVLRGKACDLPIEIDRVLLAVGVRANTEGLGLDSAGVRLDRGFIAVDEHCATSTPGVFAIGDVAGPPALAHVASAEGVHVAERLAGLSPPPIDYDAIPGCTYCRPEVASVGLTEARAREGGRDVKVGRFPFSALGKALAAGEPDGFVKVIADTRTNELLGVHLIGHGVTDLVAEPGLARSSELLAEDLLGAVHPHPTLSEAVKGAVEAAMGHAIDL
jgi:dihydrolipoamide dehydrogenase